MNKLYIGFNRTDITPTNGGIPLAGYGATSLRQAAEVMDRIYVNTIAVGNGETADLLLLTLDWINVTNEYVDSCRKEISEATGVAEDHILMGGTHTHSGPDIYSGMDSIGVYLTATVARLIDSAQRAIADLCPAKVLYGSVEAGHPGAYYNFIRHYKMVPVEKKDCWTDEDVTIVGDCFSRGCAGNPNYCYVGHEEEGDHELTVVKFDRGARDSVFVVNFAAHATLTGGPKLTKMSSDYPGMVCLEIERMIPNSHAVFYQGAAGNLNAGTRMEEEGIIGMTYGLDKDHRAYGHVLASYVERMVRQGKLTESKRDTYDFRHEVVEYPSKQVDTSLLEKAREIAVVFKAEGLSKNVLKLCADNGFNSPYQCNAIISRAQEPPTKMIELNSLRFGDVGMVTAPFELFNTLGLMIKEGSPFPVTVVKCYSCGKFSYLPSLNTVPYSYGYDCMRVAPGTGEKIAEHFAEVLTEMNEKA